MRLPGAKVIHVFTETSLSLTFGRSQCHAWSRTRPCRKLLPSLAWNRNRRPPKENWALRTRLGVGYRIGVPSSGAPGKGDLPNKYSTPSTAKPNRLLPTCGANWATVSPWPLFPGPIKRTICKPVWASRTISDEKRVIIIPPDDRWAITTPDGVARAALTCPAQRTIPPGGDKDRYAARRSPSESSASWGCGASSWWTPNRSRTNSYRYWGLGSPGSSAIAS